TISNNKTIDGSGTGVYTSVLSGLAQATTYHARAYATNSGGTAYGEEVVFRTWDIGVFTDERDGHQYRRARIGDQVWMAENLAWLPAVYPSSSGSETEKRYYVYDYQGTNINEAKTSQNYSTYGVLYNWAAAMNGGVSSNLVPSGVQGACPAGWHLPSFAEFDIFQRYLGDNAGIRLRESGNTHWVGDNVATNEFGFTALPSGSRYLEDGFQNKGYETVFRTATAVDISSSYYVKLAIYTTTLPIGGAKKGYGDAVRCIKN
ncbi:MAG: hypothetical protein NTV01_07130, partial [Bacteroidia bacterium]|nr:hypothetical protein [Bacteroidia bacterium]